MGGGSKLRQPHKSPWQDRGLELQSFGLLPGKKGPFGFASRRALETFIEHIQPYAPQLACDLTEWLARCEDGVSCEIEFRV